jgi:hypothetical protein
MPMFFTAMLSPEFAIVKQRVLFVESRKTKKG